MAGVVSITNPLNLTKNWPHHDSNEVTHTTSITFSGSTYTYNIVYSQKSSLNKNFTQPTYMYPCFTEIFRGINLCPCGKNHHRHYVIINIGQNLLETNFTHQRRGKKVKIFSGQKFPAIRYRENKLRFSVNVSPFRVQLACQRKSTQTQCYYTYHMHIHL